MLKSFLLTVIFVVSAISVFSQKEYNVWSIDGNLGVNSAIGPFAPGYASNYLGIGHVDLGGRYMFSEYFGLKLDVGFDQINNDTSGPLQNEGGYAGSASEEFRVHYYRTSLQTVFNVGHAFHLDEISHRFGLLFHGGVGFSSLKNSTDVVFFEYWRTQGTDEMMNFTWGFTPQLKMSDKLALHVDMTMVNNAWSSKTWDFTEDYFEKGFTTKLFNLSIGCSYYFGFSARHADWLISTSNRAKVGNHKPIHFH